MSRDATMTDDSATELPLLRSLLSTATAAHDGDRERDQLATLVQAREWVRQALGDPRSEKARLVLRREDLEPLREFRESLREALRARHPSDDADDVLTDDSRQAGGKDYTGSISLRWNRSTGPRLSPIPGGWQAVVSIVIAELMLAEAAGGLSRIKTCAYEPCGYPFVDRSRNSSRMWHDTAACGNLVNLRAARARKNS